MGGISGRDWSEASRAEQSEAKPSEVERSEAKLKALTKTNQEEAKD